MTVPAPSTEKPGRNAFLFVVFAVILNMLSFGIIMPVMPALLEDITGLVAQQSVSIGGWLSMTFAIANFMAMPILGGLSDRYGRRPIILIALFGAGLDYFLLAWAPTLTWFFIGRLISGITGANFSAASAYIADISPPEKRAANFGMIGAAFGLGFIIGPAAGGLLSEFGLRVPFIAAGVLTLLNAAYGLFVLPESLKPENRRGFSWKKSNPIGSLINLKRFPSVFGLAWTYFLLNIAHQVYPATWVLYTGYRYGWTSKQAGLSLAMVGLMAAIVQGGLTRKIIPRLGEERTTIFALGVTMVAFTLYGLATAGWMLYVIIIFGSLGGLANPAIQGLVSRPVAADEHGSVQGVLTSLAGLSGVFGPLVATYLFGAFTGESADPHIPGAAFFFSAALAAISTFLALVSFKRVGTAPTASEGA